jgi:hypothetical protein
LNGAACQYQHNYIKFCVRKILCIY